MVQFVRFNLFFSEIKKKKLFVAFCRVVSFNSRFVGYKYRFQTQILFVHVMTRKLDDKLDDKLFVLTRNPREMGQNRFAL